MTRRSVSRGRWAAQLQRGNQPCTKPEPRDPRRQSGQPAFGFTDCCLHHASGLPIGVGASILQRSAPGKRASALDHARAMVAIFITAIHQALIGLPDALMGRVPIVNPHQVALVRVFSPWAMGYRLRLADQPAPPRMRLWSWNLFISFFSASICCIIFSIICCISGMWSLQPPIMSDPPILSCMVFMPACI